MLYFKYCVVCVGLPVHGLSIVPVSLYNNTTWKSSYLDVEHGDYSKKFGTVSDITLIYMLQAVTEKLDDSSRTFRARYGAALEQFITGLRSYMIGRGIRV